MKKLCDVLWIKRCERRETRKQVSENTGIYVSLLKRYENEETGIKEKNLLVLADYYGFNPKPYMKYYNNERYLKQIAELQEKIAELKKKLIK